MGKSVGVVFVLIAISFIVSGCGKQKTTSSTTKSEAHSVDDWVLDPPLSVAENLSRAGKKQASGIDHFQKYCSVCHGPDGKGDGQYYSDSLDVKPANLTDAHTMGKLSNEQMNNLIKNGSSALGKSALCPPWGKVLNKDQIQSIVNHVRSLPSAKLLKSDTSNSGN